MIAPYSPYRKTRLEMCIVAAFEMQGSIGRKPSCYYVMLERQNEKIGEVFWSGGYAIGALSPEKTMEHSSAALLEANRLIRHKKDVLSSQSNGLVQPIFGGAFKIGELVVCLAGLPQIAAEAALLYQGVVSDSISASAAYELAKDADNDVYLKLAAAKHL